MKVIIYTSNLTFSFFNKEGNDYYGVFETLENVDGKLKLDTSIFKGYNDYANVIDIEQVENSNIRKVLAYTATKMKEDKEYILESYYEMAKFLTEYPDIVQALPYYLRYINPEVLEHDEMFENVNYKRRSHGVDFYSLKDYIRGPFYSRIGGDNRPLEPEEIVDFYKRRIKQYVCENLKGKVEEDWVNNPQGKEYKETWLDIPSTISVFIENLKQVKLKKKLLGMNMAYIVPLVEDTEHEVEGLRSNRKFAISKTENSNYYLVFIEKRKKINSSKKSAKKIENYCRFFNPNAELEYLTTSKKSHLLLLKV